MRRILICATVLAILSVAPTSATPPPEGCLTDSTLAAAAAKLAQEDWSNVTLGKLRQIWPTELSGLNCEADVCHSVWSMDRIIAGKCQCCVTFAFEIHQSSDGIRREQLNEVVLNYSVADRSELVHVAKAIGAAMGLTEADVTTIGTAEEQRFQKVNTTAEERELCAVEMRFTNDGEVWKLLLNWGRNRIKRSEPM